MRRAVLACFLWQSYGDAVDHVVVMFSKLMTKMERQADDALDEQLGQHRDTQRAALGVLVKAIAGLDTSLYWGEGKTSASDGQRYSLRRKVLQKTYSPRFSDFALEFYSFVADNYAPFFSTPIECTDRDAATVLDGLLYNESDLELEEHYTDTHGYTDINFAAFAMLGRRFSPRIRGLKKQRLYRVGKFWSSTTCAPDRATIYSPMYSSKLLLRASSCCIARRLGWFWGFPLSWPWSEAQFQRWSFRS